MRFCPDVFAALLYSFVQWTVIGLYISTTSTSPTFWGACEVTCYLLTYCNIYTGWPKKVSYYQMIKKLYLILLKPVNEIRFIRQLKEWIKHYTIIRRYYIFYAWLTFWPVLLCLTRNLAICVRYGKWCQRSLWHQLDLATVSYTHLTLPTKRIV